MVSTRARFVVSRCLPTALAVAALAVAGCGSDDEDGGGGNADEQAVQQTIDAMGGAMAGKDAAALCGLMSARSLAQLQVDTGGGGGGAADTAACEKVFGRSFKTNGLTEDPRPEVVAIEVKGDTATATASGGGSGQTQKAAFAKEGGQWKVVGWFTD